MRNFIYFAHGCLFAAISAVILYLYFPAASIFFSPQDTIIPIALSLSLWAIILVFSYLLTRQIKAAGLISSLLVLGLLYHALFFTLILSCSVLGILTIRIVRKRMNLEDLHHVLNLVGMILFVFFSFQFVRAAVLPSIRIDRLRATELTNDSSPTIGPETPPDIYYIILDGYGRTDMLKALHGFDNSAFIQALEQRGFVVAPHSLANYPKTILSLTSSLNMQYLDHLSAAMGDSDAWWPLTEALQHSQSRHFLEQQGYQFVSVASGWDYTNIANADMYIKPYPIMLNDFQKTFISSTNLRYGMDFFPGTVSVPSYDVHRQFILSGFASLPRTASLPGPKFVFVHILAPHPPFVFSSSGEIKDPDYRYTLLDSPALIGNLDDYRHGYVEQLLFVNGRVIETIDGILENSVRPPVIIIQADHGPGMIGNYDILDETCFQERYPILNAYYLPGVGDGFIPADIAPVNTFRLIFNHYFGTAFDMLPNRQYFSTTNTVYEFVDVTDRQTMDCSGPEKNLAP